MKLSTNLDLQREIGQYFRECDIGALHPVVTHSYPDQLTSWIPVESPRTPVLIPDVQEGMLLLAKMLRIWIVQAYFVKVL